MIFDLRILRFQQCTRDYVVPPDVENQNFNITQLLFHKCSISVNIALKNSSFAHFCKINLNAASPTLKRKREFLIAARILRPVKPDDSSVRRTSVEKERKYVSDRKQSLKVNVRPDKSTGSQTNISSFVPRRDFQKCISRFPYALAIYTHWRRFVALTVSKKERKKNKREITIQK